jgi:hypothetical protein
MMASVQRAVELLERELDEKKKDLQRLQEHEIPALMAELGFKSFKLEDGSEVSVKNYYSASINKERQDEAFRWLNEHGFGDLIKNVVSTSFSRGQESVAEQFASECLERGLNAATKKWVEPMTLKAFAKEQVEAGAPLPDELFGVYVGQKASIKKG